MNIGFLGIGKLGIPVAVAMDYKGHDVMCYDINPAQMQKQSFSHMEKDPEGGDDFVGFLQKSHLQFGTLKDIVAHSDIIFVAVQTPHRPLHEGVTRLPTFREDFDYTYLVKAMVDLTWEIKTLGKPKIVAIISTVLPGTVRKYIIPIIDEDYVKLVYSPSFIAMGSVIRNYLHPEFVLCGVYDEDAANKVEGFYKTLTDAPVFRTTIENAELIKVAYNVFLSQKILYANAIMEVCHKLGNCDVDEVTDALSLATDRLISAKYLRGGQGDGGACHPRDGIALSWLSQRLGLSYDIFENIMLAREKQAEWLCDLVTEESKEHKLPVAILGTAFKAGTNIETGSAALLCKNILEERGYDVWTYDPYINDRMHMTHKRVYLIGANHPEFVDYPFPEGSVVIDPWGYIPNQEGVEIIHVGRNRPVEHTQ